MIAVSRPCPFGVYSCLCLCLRKVASCLLSLIIRLLYFNYPLFSLSLYTDFTFFVSFVFLVSYIPVV